MSVAVPSVIECSNISAAWSQLFLNVFNRTPRERTPVLVSIADFTGEVPNEDGEIRSAVDDTLQRCGKYTSGVSAMTIFPYELWLQRGRPSWESFHSFCIEKFYPRIRARSKANRHGTYFERMMSFSGQRGGESRTVDQLGFIIKLLKGSRWPRESALQMSCFDPVKDHTGQPVRGFPCLQQVGLSHDGDSRICVNAFYPTQYIFERAYGNYLGLCQLGSYIAHQTGLTFARFNCFIGKPDLGNMAKRDLAAR